MLVKLYIFHHVKLPNILLMSIIRKIIHVIVIVKSILSLYDIDTSICSNILNDLRCYKWIRLVSF